MTSSSRFNPCLLIPVYNHGKQLPATLEKLASSALTCLLVNDGSESETTNVINEMAERYKWVKVQHLSVNSGKGVAVLTGIRWAQDLGYSHCVQIDADGQHDVDDIPAMLALAEKNPAALISGRPQYDDSVPKGRLYGRFLTHFWVWIETLSLSIQDSMCGFRVYPVKESICCDDRNNIGSRMDFDTDIMVRMYWDDIPVLFVPTRVVYPEGGHSNFDMLSDNLKISWLHTRLFFGMLPRIPKLLTRRWRLPPVVGLSQTQNTQWHETPERGAYWGMRISLWTYQVLGKKAMYVLLRFIVFYFFLFSGRARKASQEFLRQVYADPRQNALARSPTLWDSYRHFYHFSDAQVDKVSAWSGEIGFADFDFHAREKLRSYEKGVVLLSSHLGNMDMCRALTNHSRGKKINVLLNIDGAPGMNKLLQKVNPQSQVELISVREIGPGTAPFLLEKIEAGEWIVIAADRLSPDNPQRATPVTFFGRQAWLPQGAFVLAAMMQCPVYAAFALKEQGRYSIHVELLSELIPFSRRERQKVMGEIMERYVQLLEEYCRRAPMQWFNFYDFWQPLDNSVATKESD